MSFRRSDASGSERRYSAYYFACFTSAKVQILTQLEQFAVGNYALALDPLGIDPATVPPDSALAFVRHAPLLV